MPKKITLSKIEYDQLKRQAGAYQKFASHFFELVITDPIANVIKDFRNTDLYTEKFLVDLEDGLRKSSYSQKYANQASKKRVNRVYQEA